MSEYAVINAAFSAVFNGAAPAARVAVQLPLNASAGCTVAVECLAWAGEKRLLHVQSISEWAPRMIGPYCQLTVGQGACFVAGSIGLIPASMALVKGGAQAQASLALQNCASVLRGLSMRAADTMALVMYITHGSDAAHTHGIAAQWLQRVAGEQVTDALPLPSVLVLQVGALPMGALVEAQLQACEASAPAFFRAHWRHPVQQAKATFQWDATFSGACFQTAAKGSDLSSDEHTACKVANGVLTGILSAEGDACISADLVGAAVVMALDELTARLFGCSPPWTLGRSLFARVFYEETLHVFAGRLGSALGATISHSSRYSCSAFALPVDRVHVPEGGARLAVQLHVSATSDLDPESDPE